MWIDLALWAASALVFCAFFARSIYPLRAIAIASNVAFVIYAVGAWNVPILILHCALFPLNILRLHEHARVLRQLRFTGEGAPHVEKLVPLMDRRNVAKGSVIFEKGDRADAMYVLITGEIALPEIGITLGAGTIFGEMALFLKDKNRTASAKCLTDCEVGVMSGERLKELVMLDPAFGLYLTGLIAARMNENNTRSLGRAL